MPLPEHVVKNRDAWTRFSPQYVDPGRRSWSTDQISWGIWGVPEREVGALRGLDFRGKDPQTLRLRGRGPDRHLPARWRETNQLRVYDPGLGSTLAERGNVARKEALMERGGAPLHRSQNAVRPIA